MNTFNFFVSQEKAPVLITWHSSSDFLIAIQVALTKGCERECYRLCLAILFGTMKAVSSRSWLHEVTLYTTCKLRRRGLLKNKTFLFVQDMCNKGTPPIALGHLFSPAKPPCIYQLAL
eukprot:c7294_g1_i1 orf=19-372(-)